ncbi:MAG TPA: hypothetical protein VJJ98_14550 [Sedimentisphaerales bacterium]|nr:hypothetical protein [Sedimentisphaerales bacterium]
MKRKSKVLRGLSLIMARSCLTQIRDQSPADIITMSSLRAKPMRDKQGESIIRLLAMPFVTLDSGGAAASGG